VKFSDRINRWLSERRLPSIYDQLFRLEYIVFAVLLIGTPIYIINLFYPALTDYSTMAMAVFAFWIVHELKARTGDLSIAMVSLGVFYTLLYVTNLVVTVAQR